ncbi:hypothetical protein FNV43_RR03152 [Rhamnella rubrinervis]|uniref:Uncharacterized protein n=1 Tax=Rhamnella rubrinervis TaxID=2594499 RepID=A0A8K0MNS6_9ROSA|nr:hypothetical protein FNV43_RR03152 [Rhamnella rubrinervis]
MAAWKHLVFFLFVAQLFTRVAAKPPLRNDDHDHDVASAPEVSDSSVAAELEQLKFKVLFLEKSINEKNRELREKEESSRQMEEIIIENSDTIAALRSEIESLQEGPIDDRTLMCQKLFARTGELEKQVERIRKDIIIQDKKKDGIEAQDVSSEKKIRELNLKLEDLQKVNDEQKTVIQRTEQALQVAEKKIMKAKLDAASISTGLNMVNEGWLPHWLLVHLNHFQALEKKSQVEDWVALHIEIFKRERIPILRNQCSACIIYLVNKFQQLTAKTVDICCVLKSSIAPHVLEVLKFADPYIQKVTKFSEPYIHQVAMVTRPHLDRVRAKVFPAYTGFITSTTLYHQQVQEMLKNSELTRSVATMDLAWFVATALIALPAVFVLKLYSAIFSKTAKKRNRSSYHGTHIRRRPKRGHPDFEDN